eukprot:2832538-Pyramimonas_sp.AAC.1
MLSSDIIKSLWRGSGFLTIPAFVNHERLRGLWGSHHFSEGPNRARTQAGILRGSFRGSPGVHQVLAPTGRLQGVPRLHGR